MDERTALPFTESAGAAAPTMPVLTDGASSDDVVWRGRPSTSGAPDGTSALPDASPSAPRTEPSDAERRRRRNELVEEHRPFAEHFVRRYLHRGVAAEDLRQSALLALVHAAERFDPDRGVAFTTFAGATIDGTLKRYFRDRTWSVRPPRRTQELHLRLRKAEEELSQQLGRHPTVAELASKVDETVDHVLEALEASAAHNSVSVDARPFDDAEQDPADRSWLGVVESGYGLAETRLILAQVLEGLNERDRRIIELRFIENRSQQQIGEELGISQSYLSRVMRRLLASMRREIGELAPHLTPADRLPVGER